MDEREQVHEYIQRWKKLGPLLEEIKWRELREFDYDANWQIIDDLLEAGLQHAQERTTSGLLEQQRRFMRIREIMNRQESS